MTTKFTEFSKVNLPFLRDDINAELKALGEKYGIVLHAGNATFSPTACTIKLEIALEGEKTIKDARKESSLEMYGNAYLSNFDVNATYTLPSLSDFKFVGYNSRARKSPFEVKQLSSGKVYVLTHEQARMAKKK
jgi:hypothetical protein